MQRRGSKGLTTKRNAGGLTTSCLSTLRCLSKTPIILVILLIAAFVKATIKDVPRTNQVACTLACIHKQAKTQSTTGRRHELSHSRQPSCRRHSHEKEKRRTILKIDLAM